MSVPESPNKGTHHATASPQKAPQLRLNEGPKGPVDAIVRLKEYSSIVQRAMLALPNWVTPNGVTVFRAVLVVPLIAMIAVEAYLASLTLFIFAMFLDFVDGALAHARDMKSETGAFLDPLADKITVCGVLLAVIGKLPESALGPILCIAVFAVSLTLLRMGRMLRARDPHERNVPSIAASSIGKVKLISETAAISLVLLALSTGGAGLLTAALVAIWVSAILGIGSYMGQVFQ